MNIVKNAAKMNVSWWCLMWCMVVFRRCPDGATQARHVFRACPIVSNRGRVDGVPRMDLDVVSGWCVVVHV